MSDKLALSILVILALPLTCHALDFSNMMGGMGPPVPFVAYNGWYEPSAGTNPSSGEVSEQKLSAQFPMAHKENDFYSANIGVSDLRFGQQQTFSSTGQNTGQNVPRELGRVDIGAGFSRKLAEDKMLGARITVGSASDKPFANIDTTTFTLTGFYSFPGQTEQARWMISVFMSNNNPIANYFPIPGFGYMYRTPTFFGLFGFPFAAIQWSPYGLWTYSLAMFGPEINLETAYGPKMGLQGFVGYSWIEQSYLPVSRPSYDDRLYYDEMRAFFGVRKPFSNFSEAHKIVAELQSGYAFNRKVYEGTKIFNDSLGSTTLCDTWFAMLNIKLDL